MAGVFLVATAKLRSRDELKSFFQMVRSMRLLPSALVRPAGTAVAASEACVVILLALPGMTEVGYMLAGALLLTFMVSSAIVIHRGTSVTCSCFGRADIPVGPVHLVRDGLLLLCVIVGLSLTPTGHMDIFGVTVAVMVAAAAVLIMVGLADFMSLFFHRG